MKSQNPIPGIPMMVQIVLELWCTKRLKYIVYQTELDDVNEVREFLNLTSISMEGLK